MPVARSAPAGFHGAFRQSMSWFHTWLGLLAGVVLYFIFVTGTTGYAHFEISRWMKPELGKMTAAAPPRPIAEQAEAALALAMERQPGAPLVYLTLPTDPREQPAVVNIYAEPPEAAEGAEAGAVYEGKLDPATLQEFAPAEVRETAGGETLYAMHYNLHYIPFESLTLFGVTLPAWPTLIVGVATMFMLTAIVTGIVVHKKIFADFFTFRPRKGQRSWLDAHNLSSVLALPFMVMITYSGLLMYAFDYMPTVKTLAYGTEPDARVTDCELYDYWCARREPAGEPAAMAPLGPMIAQAQARWPDMPIKWIDAIHWGDRAATVFVWPGADAEVTGGYPYMGFDGATGAVIAVSDGGMGAVNDTGSLMLKLHEGHFAGPMLRWLYLLSGAMGAAMVATGLILWSVKRRQRLSAGGRADLGLVFVERTNVAIVAGLLIGITAYFWANRLLPLGMEGRADWEVHAMFIAWGACFLHAALRPARRAWIEQLAVLTLGLALLPVVNALTTGIHLGRTLFVPAAERDWVLASFDLTMLGLAACFALALRHVAVRPSAAAPRRPERPGRAAAGAATPAE